jgi:hypothetical protein
MLLDGLARQRRGRFVLTSMKTVNGCAVLECGDF